MTTLHQVGYHKPKTVLDWDVENFPNPEIVTGGSSTEALANQALSTLVADTREVEEKNIRYTAFGDSNADVMSSEYTAASSSRTMVRAIWTSMFAYLGDFLKAWMVANSSVDTAALAASLSASGITAGSSSSLSSEESVNLELPLKLPMASMSRSIFPSFGCRFSRLGLGFLS
ncbi:hypothetical protein PF010_g19513 [Phytophthora fragariae]|uniref:Uncharacterized protein n=2 Tax=Phytophthora fragariae TaxID=53985 RepID=A0A6A3KM51_9STRA|nr:hypothetical protein PF009_g21056 [Phytophthora fragariae]KAE9008456.1 hypothetical protein PF011_g10703 [Phytophthora fragariae]KAE9088035.1 hypothetical protein PF010_g19513 [Phytophthora fragariae]KAE9153321.1 hypothetical protein PF006_g2525 [Phytophthora fragariae]KAE9253402.1 hypothetical protein PF002_g3340 [Phytophthora fragariae]